MDQGTIQSSTRYSQFKLMGANREIDDSHVKKLKNSFAEYGNFTQARPILVNERMEVIDGQHRLEAVKQLREPVYFTIVPGLTIHEARAMNLLQKNWKPIDFARSYAATGLASYKNYLILIDEYPEVRSHSVIMSYALGHEQKGAFADFKRGDFVFNNLPQARELLDNLVELAGVQPEFTQRNLALALLSAMSVDTYDQERMVEQAKHAGANFAAYQSTGDNLRMLENLYNKNRTVNRLRFF